MSFSNGSAITVAPNTIYRATEIIQRRLYRGATHESLVKWTLLLEEDAEDGEEGAERVTKSYELWMRREELEACCPHLLASREPEKEPAKQEGVHVHGGDDAEVAREAGESELEDEVRMLVARALDVSASGGSSKVLTNRLRVLSAYARIGTMANVFRQVGALDFLLTLLSSHHLGVRQGASDMLHSLAKFDAGNRAYVLMKLSQSSGGEEGGGLKTTVQSRQMLLDLFAETASSSEGELCSDANLPHVSIIGCRRLWV